MAISKALVASLLIYLLLTLVQANHQVMGKEGAESKFVDKKMDCGAACRTRCQLSSRPNLCNRACGTCCARCNCVPPGTSGHQEVCPCYYAMTTHGGRRKCP